LISCGPYPLGTHFSHELPLYYGWSNHTLIGHEQAIVHFLVLQVVFCQLLRLLSTHILVYYRTKLSSYVKVTKILHHWFLLVDRLRFCEKKFYYISADRGRSECDYSILGTSFGGFPPHHSWRRACICPPICEICVDLSITHTQSTTTIMTIFPSGPAIKCVEEFWENSDILLNTEVSTRAQHDKPSVMSAYRDAKLTTRPDTGHQIANWSQSWLPKSCKQKCRSGPRYECRRRISWNSV